MASKVVVFFAALAACGAVPVIIDDEYVPGVIMRIGRSPNVAFGFGSGFSSNIGGISHSTGMGSSFQSGDAQAYGAGMGSNGNYASGVGMASAGPSYPVYQQQPYGLRNNFGSAVSSAQTQNGFRYGAAQNNPRYQSAVASAQNLRGYNNDFGSAVAASQYSGNYGTAMSAAQNHGLGHFGSAVSAAENNGHYRASTAQAMQHHGGAVQHSGASSVNAPGLQAAQSHAVNSGFY
ncbi:probable peroxisomal membrane protein PEX13 [Leguminivora glycinivorella]|uniref:probable peroxisomal membrane protein PEX13 n=1 Tax=Leguminivora glycinivorella TaxID=1035111 RepID=UPI002010A9FA|nr:probable peroxisomal membrane protein PEX13 [Leguminivora glycinivorella]